MQKVHVKFGEWIEEGFNLYKNNFGTLVLASVIVLVLSKVTIFILALFPCIGILLSPFFACAALAFLMFGIFLIVDRQMNFWPASLESIHTVKANFWPFLGLSVVTSIIGSIGAIAFGIGIVLTIPIQVCILAVAYRDVFNEIKRPSTPDFTQSADPV